MHLPSRLALITCLIFLSSCSSCSHEEKPQKHDQVRRAAQNGLAYIDALTLESIGLSYTPTDYPFAIPYPRSNDLGNFFVTAFVIEAEQAMGQLEKAKELGRVLLSHRDSNGLFSFDRFRYSVDADTTLTIALALHGVGLLAEPALREALSTIASTYQVDCRYGAFPIKIPGHPNRGTHPEVSHNMLYALAQRPPLEGIQTPQCISERMRRDQLESGFFQSYWYPDKLLAHYTALRALEAYSKREDAESGAREALIHGLRYLLDSQHPDGSWGEPPNAFDTALALTALRLEAAGTNNLSTHDATMRGVEYLLREQREDGSWPGSRIFYWYYPQCPDQTCPEEWHDRARPVLTTAMAVRALSSMLPPTPERKESATER